MLDGCRSRRAATAATVRSFGFASFGTSAHAYRLVDAFEP
jgi:hypothetical protein